MVSREVYDLVRECAERSKAAARKLAIASETAKNAALERIAESLLARQAEILAANSIDMENGRAKGLSSALLDRLLLTPERIAAMAEGVREVMALPDPVGEITELKPRPSGIKVGKMRVPLGVIGIIYEARPNVTVDAAALCLKAGNSVLLRGGSEAFNSNTKLAQILSEALMAAGLPNDAVQLIPTTDRASIKAMATLDDLIDVLIARGGESLMSALAGATVPLFKHGKGICHTYIDLDADLAKAIEIAFNAKVSRPGVCNAMETLLVHREIAPRVLPELGRRLQEAGVELVGDETVQQLIPGTGAATEEDWATEYLALKLAIRVVDSFAEAVEHIQRYGSQHSEAIVTENYATALRFLEQVDAAAVFVNASTRFNDGGQFGLGAEIGISTQKLHARGPMGIRELTTTKFVVFGNGEVR
ncbi:MAG: glutamate-5-semialdehyde dehydrogenase [Firmicutes bacterium]|nr:glutamate-5-semialdehyde dehydrogenase [Bacillota bacterium]